MIKLTFTSDEYGSITIPFYKIFIHNFNSESFYFSKDYNNKITFLDDPSNAFAWYYQLKDLPTVDELTETGNQERIYYWNKDPDLRLYIRLRTLPDSVVGATNLRNYTIAGSITSNEYGAFLASFGCNYIQPSAYYTATTNGTYGIDTLCYDPINKAFASIKPHRLIIKGMERLSGYNQDYGDYSTIIVKSIPYEKGSELFYADPGITWMGKEFNSYTKIPYGQHMETSLFLNLIHSSFESSGKKEENRLYYYLYKRSSSSDPDSDFDIDDGSEDDPYDDDDGSQGNPDYDDDTGGDGDHDDSSDKIPEDEVPSLSATSNGLITAWNLSSSQLANLAKKIWDPDVFEAIKQYFSNPMGAILGLSVIPVSPSGTSGTIHLGSYDTGITAQKLSNDFLKVSLGSLKVTRYYGSYLDYSPFTRISLILPYVGEVELDPDQVMEKTLSISYHINCVTGEFCAYVLADNNIISTYTGNCARQLPICQTDYSAIIASTIQLTTTALTMGASLAAPPVTAGLSTMQATAQASASNIAIGSATLNNVINAKPMYKHSSQLGNASGQLSTQSAYLIISRPNLDLANNYKSFVGYPCNKNKSIGQCVGFTQIEASHLSIPSATLEEISEIKELLLKGVIL